MSYFPVVKIIAPKRLESGLLSARGTEVLINGNQIDGVAECELIAKPGNLWQVRLLLNAEIHFEVDDKPFKGHQAEGECVL